MMSHPFELKCTREKLLKMSCACFPCLFELRRNASNLTAVKKNPSMVEKKGTFWGGKAVTASVTVKQEEEEEEECDRGLADRDKGSY